MNEKTSQRIMLKELIVNSKKIILITIISSIVAVIITFFLPKKYYAEGIVYPTSSNSIKDVVNNSNFGHEYQTDRLLQLFESQQMKEMIVKRFNLINYYELDTNSKDWRYKLNKKYSRDISFTRSKFIAVKVSAKTKSPTMSADIVNSMLDYIDTIRKDILFENVYALKEDLSKKVEKRQKSVDSLLALISGVKEKIKPNPLANKLISKLEENQRNGQVNYGNDIIIKAAKENYTLSNAKTINEYYTQLSIFSNLKRDLISIEEKISMPFPKVYIVSSAIPDYKKASPSFLLNTIFGFLIGLIGSITFFVVKKSWKTMLIDIKNE